jgi:hypothetical protein
MSADAKDHSQPIQVNGSLVYLSESDGLERSGGGSEVHAA